MMGITDQSILSKLGGAGSSRELVNTLMVSKSIERLVTTPGGSRK